MIHAFDTTFVDEDQFLKRHICNGEVDYRAAKEDPMLDSIMYRYAALPEKRFKSFSKNVRLAALINLYNCATIKLIVDHFPIGSIRDIPDAWKKRRIDFIGKKVSLDQIEHEMLRKNFDEPRIHFALVCAAKSCPELRKGAFTPSELEIQLEAAGKKFLMDTTKNSFGEKKLSLSKIFSWYGDDFIKRYGGFEQYVKQRYGINGSYRIVYREYDWSLNQTDCSR